MSSHKIIVELRHLHAVLQAIPTHDEILLYIKHTRMSYIDKFIARKKKRFVQKSFQNKRDRKVKIKKAVERARSHAIRKYDTHVIQPLLNELYLSIEDGWENRKYKEIGIIIFMFKGYIIECCYQNNLLSITNVLQSRVLQTLLENLAVIFHLDSNGCTFQESFLNDKLNACSAIANTMYREYLPMPPKLRRSYHFNLYEEVASNVVNDGWGHRAICDFDENCNIFQLNSHKYKVRTCDAEIDEMSQV